VPTPEALHGGTSALTIAIVGNVGAAVVICVSVGLIVAKAYALRSQGGRRFKKVPTSSLGGCAGASRRAVDDDDDDTDNEDDDDDGDGDDGDGDGAAPPWQRRASAAAAAADKQGSEAAIRVANARMTTGFSAALGSSSFDSSSYASTLPPPSSSVASQRTSDPAGRAAASHSGKAEDSPAFSERILALLD